MNKLMAWVIWGMIILNLLGFFIDSTWLKDPKTPGYFSYTIGLLGNFPFWILATLVFLTVNGAASLYFARVRFHASARDGNYQGGFSLPPIKATGD
jgi:hypothetical protein